MRAGLKHEGHEGRTAVDEKDANGSGGGNRDQVLVPASEDYGRRDACPTLDGLGDDERGAVVAAEVLVGFVSAFAGEALGIELERDRRREGQHRGGRPRTLLLGPATAGPLRLGVCRVALDTVCSELKGDLMGFTSWWHWAIVAIVLLILFGSKKLPDAARGLGQSLRIFKSEVKEMQKDDDKDAQATTDAAATDPARRELPAGDSTQPATQRDADAKKSA